MDADPTLTLLREASGPPPPAPDLPRLWRTGRRRRMIRRLAPVIALALVGLGGALAFALAGDGSPRQAIIAGPPRTHSRPASAPPVTQPAGAAPVAWTVDIHHLPTTGAGSFVALVSQSGCPGPFATDLNDLNEPTVVERSGEVDVQFTTLPSRSTKSCHEVRTTPFVVHLMRPLGHRRLVDRTCRRASGQCDGPPVERWPHYDPTLQGMTWLPLAISSVRSRRSGPCLSPGYHSGPEPRIEVPGIGHRSCYVLLDDAQAVGVASARAERIPGSRDWRVLVTPEAGNKHGLGHCPAGASCSEAIVAIGLSIEVIGSAPASENDQLLTLGPFRRGTAEGLALAIAFS